MISILVTAYKEHKTIGKAIEAILNQKINQKHEIVVVAPDKETLAVAKKYKQVRSIKDPGKGKPKAMNYVFPKLKGDIVVLTDGDVFLETGAIKKLLPHFKDKKIGAVSGRPIPTNSKNELYGYWAHLLADMGAHEQRLKDDKDDRPFVMTGYLYAMRKKLFDKIPDSFFGDDPFVSYTIWSKGYKLKYEQNAVVYYKAPTNFKDWINQKRRSGGAYLTLKNYFDDLPQFRSLSREVLYGWYRPLKYAKKPKEFGWSILLYPARLWLWILSFWSFKIKKIGMKELWVRVESTK